MKFIGIIPARYASTRFPGKPLADLCGKTMIQRVYEQASKALDVVLVATDDERIFNHVNSFGRAVMTSSHHRSGTDRCYEAYCLSGEMADVIINIQGDEPFVQPNQIEALKQCFPTDIATLAKPFTVADELEDLTNPNNVKVVFSTGTKEALYFSRSVIPYLRGVDKKDWLQRARYYKHVGMYAYTVDALKKVSSMQPSTLEQTESLEQLRWLENGLKIRVAECDTYSIGIDTPDDMERAIAYLRSLQG